VRGFANLAFAVAYTPARPAPVVEVISTSTRSEAAAPWGAVVSVIEGVWRCNMALEKHARMNVVKRLSTSIDERMIEANIVATETLETPQNQRPHS
jgi:hypothetical protein